MANPESPDADESLNGGDQSAQFYRSLQQEIIARGDRQLPDEPNRGFEIVRLEREPLEHPVPAREALPLSYLEFGQDSTAVNRLAVDDLTQRLMAGANNLDPVDKIPFSGLGLKVDYPVGASDYQSAVVEGTAEANLFDAEGIATGTQPGAKTLEPLVESDEKSAALEAALTAKASDVRFSYQDDLGGLPEYNLNARERKELEGLLEAYDLSDSGRTIRIMNFSATHLSEEQLRQGTNAIRSSSDKSGGAVFDTLRTVVILPETHSSLKVKVKDEEGEFEIPRNGWQGSEVLALSERSIQTPEARKSRTEREKKYFDKFFDSFRLEGEPTEGPDSPRASVSGGDWEAVLAHELEHIALPHKGNTMPLPGPAPTLYGRSQRIEQMAELGAAEYMGGEDALAVPEDQRQAKQEMWQRHRGSTDGGIAYKQPLGPRFVTCQELDLANGPLPLRLKKPVQTVPAEITYHLV